MSLLPLNPLYRCRAGLLALPVLLAGCAQPTPLDQQGFDGPDPQARLYAIQQAGETRDRTAVPRLIDLLDSDDPAERVLALGALERVLGQRPAFNPYAPLPTRRPQVDALRQAYRQGTLASPPDSPPDSSPESPSATPGATAFPPAPETP